MRGYAGKPATKKKKSYTRFRSPSERKSDAQKLAEQRAKRIYSRVKRARVVPPLDPDKTTLEQRESLLYKRKPSPSSETPGEKAARRRVEKKKVEAFRRRFYGKK